jgi:hypothetical protein
MRKNGYRKEDITAAQADVDRAAAMNTDALDSTRRSQKRSGFQTTTIPPKPVEMALVPKKTPNTTRPANRGYRPEEVSAEGRYAQARPRSMRRGNRREDIDSAQAALADEARFRERQFTDGRDCGST